MQFVQQQLIKYVVENIFEFLAGERIKACFILAQYFEYFFVSETETFFKQTLLSYVVIVNYVSKLHAQALFEVVRKASDLVIHRSFHP